MSETKGECRQQLEAWYANNSSSVPRYSWMVADAIDRLAADVAAVKEAVCGNRITAEETKKIQSDMEWVNKHEQWRREERDAARLERDAAIRERDQWREEARLAVINRDEARAEVEKLKGSRDVANRLFGAEQAKVERLRKELEQRQPAGNSPKTSDSSPAAPQPAGQGISPKVADTQPTGNAAPAAGWLTEDERELLQSRLHWLRVCLWTLFKPYRRSITREVEIIDALLSRAGSPPVVEVPAISERDVPKRNEALAYRAALDKAGVSWKEAGRE